MKTPSFLRISLPVVLGAFATISASAFAGVPAVAHPATASALKAKAQVDFRRDYIKSLPGSSGAIGAAQTAIRRFTPLHGNGPSVYLVAAVHIGEKSYYKQIQQFLDKQDVVLYEGVSPSRRANKTNTLRPTRRRAFGAGKPPEGMYTKVSRALNLQSQMEGIRYDRPQFRNSDLDWDALNALAIKAGPDTQRLLTELKNAVAGSPTVSQDNQMLDQIVSFSESTPLVSTLLRRLFVIGLCEPDKLPALIGMNPQTSGVPASTTKLNSIIIGERNKAVLADLKIQLHKIQLQKSKRTSKPVRSIAIFYGAAHMRDIEQHLVSELGYRGAEAQWITAIAAR